MFKKMTATVEELNPVTEMIYALSDSLRAYWYIYIVGVVIAIFVIRFIIKSPPIQAFWEKNKMTFPLIGELINKTVLARFCRIFSTLLAGGVTAVEALKSAGPTSGSEKLEKAVKEAIEDIEEGKNISDALDKSGIFPPMLTGMVAIGEESGALPELLDKVAEFFEEDVENTSRNLRAIIEPIALVFVGVIVGGMLIALYVPMLTSSTSMGA